MSVYIARNAKNKNFQNCTKCDNLTLGHSDYIRRREYAQGWLCTPSDKITNVVSKIQNIIYDIKNDLYQNHVKMYIKTLCLILIEFNDIGCHEHNRKLQIFLLDFCIRFFLHNYCKDVTTILNGKRPLEENDDNVQRRAMKIFKRSHKKKNLKGACSLIELKRYCY